jgi:hypothetical protein
MRKTGASLPRLETKLAQLAVLWVEYRSGAHFVEFSHEVAFIPGGVTLPHNLLQSLLLNCRLFPALSVWVLVRAFQQPDNNKDIYS